MEQGRMEKIAIRQSVGTEQEAVKALDFTVSLLSIQVGKISWKKLIWKTSSILGCSFLAEHKYS